MLLPDGFALCGSSVDGGIVRTDLADLPLQHWWGQGKPVPNARGRGGLTLMPLPGPGVAAVRDYRRGGVLAGLRGDRFQSPDRVQRELAVTCWLRQHGIPCVEPVAGLWRKERGAFRLRLATLFLPDALTLPMAMATAPEQRRSLVTAAGSLVRMAFAVGLLHKDLHPDNILVQQGRPLLVDLDRAVVVPDLGEQARDRMLVRLSRYLFRHERRLPIRVSTAEHLRFLRALEGHRQGARQGFLRLQPKLKRALALRRLAFWRKATES